MWIRGDISMLVVGYTLAVLRLREVVLFKDSLRVCGLVISSVVSADHSVLAVRLPMLHLLHS